jgi:hypothetical protein
MNMEDIADMAVGFVLLKEKESVDVLNTPILISFTERGAKRGIHVSNNLYNVDIDAIRDETPGDVVGFIARCSDEDCEETTEEMINAPRSEITMEAKNVKKHEEDASNSLSECNFQQRTIGESNAMGDSGNAIMIVKLKDSDGNIYESFRSFTATERLSGRKRRQINRLDI